MFVFFLKNFLIFSKIKRKNFTYRLWHKKSNLKNRLLIDFDDFSTSVTTARTLLRILAYFFLQIGNFFWRFRKIAKKSILGVFWCIFRYMKVLCEIKQKTPLKGTYMVKNMPSRCIQNAWNYFFFGFSLKNRS